MQRRFLQDIWFDVFSSKLNCMRKLYTTTFVFVALFASYLSRAQNSTDKTILDLIRKNAVQLQLSTADVENVMISYSYTDSRTNIRYVYLQQAFRQIKVYNSIKTIIFRDNDVLYSSGNFIQEIEQKAGNYNPAVPAEQAIVKTAQHLQLPITTGIQVMENRFQAEKKLLFSTGGISKGNIETELLWVASDDGSTVRLAWNVNIDEVRSSDWWNVRIDAFTGSFIEKNNWTIHEAQPLETDAVNSSDNKIGSMLVSATPFMPVQRQDQKVKQYFVPYAPPTVTSAGYYVVPHPVESPRHGVMTTVTNPWLNAGAGNNATTNGWHFDGTTNYAITRGNNVHAYLDIANSNNPASATNTPVLSTTPDPVLSFGYIPNFVQQPTATINRQAAVTNLFYWNNIIHDVLYQYGFNEVSGNFQTDNLGRGGAGNDYVQAEAQDASGTDNANFATPADGSRPRMQMYLWAGVPSFTVNGPAAIAGSYFATESGFSANNKLNAVGPVTGQVQYYNDASVTPTTHFACNGTTPGSLTGKIAMIIRGGGCVAGFIEKVKNAQNNGAIAVIMVNNVAGLPITMGGADNTIIIPAVMISDIDGALLAAQLANNVNVTLAGGVNLDGDLDNGIVCHEFGHGVSNRLTGGAPNSGCLGNTEQGGEGWSDYIGLMLTTKWATATLNDGTLKRPIGVYALGHPLNGQGIRTAPYSTNMATSPQSYSNIASMVAPHGIGEIWCSAIWDMTWNIIQQEGVINPNIYDANGGGGNTIAFKLVLEGMRLQPCRPGFLDGRDAILAADSILYNGRHKCAIWNAFARRGMGYSASQGNVNSSTDGAAAFDIPASIFLSKQSAPLTVIQGEQVAVNLTATCQCQINANLILRDTIPAGFTYISSTGGTLSGNVVSFPPLSFSTFQETKSFSIVLQPNVAGCAITTPINDDRDANTTGGLTSVIATGATNWVTSTTRSSSPTSSWFAASNNTTRDFSLTSPAFIAGSLSVFSFKHFFITKNTIEGGRVEYSTDGGTIWNDAAPFILQKGYNTTATVAPWGAGQPMFGGVSYGRASGQFIHTIVNFSSLSGQSVLVRLRSRGTTTNVGTYEGWFVDDILQMNGCGGIAKAGLYNTTGTRLDSLASPVFIKTGTAVAISPQPVNTPVCIGKNVVFTSGANAAVSPTYQWQISTNGGVSFTDIPGQTGPVLTVTSVTLAMNGYQYRLIARSGTSSGFVISNPAILTVNALPVLSLTPLVNRICLSDTLVPLIATPAGGTWSGVGASGNNFIPSATAVGNYTLTYTYTSPAGCTNTASVIAKVEDCPERLILLRDNAVILFPNPNNGRFNIRINSTLYNYLGMKVFTSAGQLVKEQNFGGLVFGRVIPIDMSNMPAATYMVKFYYDDGVRTSEKTFKVVVGR
jgi:extracellular elastinolytic metalloproteinase